MELIQQLQIYIQCQKNTSFDIVPLQGGSRDGAVEWPFAQDGVNGTFTLLDIPGGVEGWLSLKLPCNPIDENQHLAMENPVTLKLRLAESPEKITAMYRYNDWWTRPVFIRDFSQIPERTQIAFLKYPNRYVCLVPAVGESFKACLAPEGGDTLRLELTAAMGGQGGLNEPVLLWMEDASIYGAVKKAFDYLATEINFQHTDGE